MATVELLALQIIQFASLCHTAVLRPNIVLLFPDQWRFDWADNYYNEDLYLHTPTFSAVARNGTRFVNTAVCSPTCAPSRACIAAGRGYGDTGVKGNENDYPVNQTTIYNLMQKAGYWVMMAGKDDLTKPNGVGMEGDYRQKDLGFSDQRRCIGKRAIHKTYPNVTDPYGTYLSTHDFTEDNVTKSEYKNVHHCNKKCNSNNACPEPLAIHDESYQDNWITTRTLKMMDDIPDNTPWFVQVNWAGPHPPFTILESMMEEMENRTFPFPMGCKKNKTDMAMMRMNYAAEIENLDVQFSRILDRVRSMGQYENTVICISSDHGEMLGDYNAFLKAVPWVASTNVPLVCMGPDIERGQIIETYISNMDLAGTFLDYTGSQMEEEMTTMSLRPFLNGTWNDEVNMYRDYVSSGLHKWRAVIQDINETVTWKFICCKGQCPGRSFKAKNGFVQLLFNIKKDLYEENDLFANHQDVADEMRELLPSGFCVVDSVFPDIAFTLIVMTPVLVALLLLIGALNKIAKWSYSWWKLTESNGLVHFKDFVIDNGCNETTALIQP